MTREMPWMNSESMKRRCWGGGGSQRDLHNHNRWWGSQSQKKTSFLIDGESDACKFNDRLWHCWHATVLKLITDFNVCDYQMFLEAFCEGTWKTTRMFDISVKSNMSVTASSSKKTKTKNLWLLLYPLLWFLHLSKCFESVCSSVSGHWPGGYRQQHVSSTGNIRVVLSFLFLGPILSFWPRPHSTLNHSTWDMRLTRPASTLNRIRQSRGIISSNLLMSPTKIKHRERHFNKTSYRWSGASSALKSWVEWAKFSVGMENINKANWHQLNWKQ